MKDYYPIKILIYAFFLQDITCLPGIKYNKRTVCDPNDVDACSEFATCQTYDDPARPGEVVSNCYCKKEYKFDAKNELNSLKTNDHCVDINECQTNQALCQENSSCVNKFGGYQCQCNSGFKEIKLPNYNLCHDINECKYRVFKNGKMENICGDVSGSVCVNTIGSYECECLEGFDRRNKYKTCQIPDEKSFIYDYMYDDSEVEPETNTYDNEISLESQEPTTQTNKLTTPTPKPKLKVLNSKKIIGVPIYTVLIVLGGFILILVTLVVSYVWCGNQRRDKRLEMQNNFYKKGHSKRASERGSQRSEGRIRDSRRK